jgi:hypothetical protein
MSSFSLPAVALVLLTSLVLLEVLDWRFSIGALGLQYLGVFLLVALTWPIELAVIKLVTGWMCGAILGLTNVNYQGDVNAEQAWPTERLFRILTASLVVIAVLAFSPRVEQWIPSAAAPQIWGSFLLIGMGLLNVGITRALFAAILGLMTVVSGFEIIYAAVEASTLVAGLLAVINLGIALVGSYLMSIAPASETT